MHRSPRFAPFAVFACALLAAGAASAQVVAGWDFSQYFNDGLLSVDGEGFTATLPANYSDFDETYGAGAESAAYGTMFLNGAFGSTSTPLDIENDPLVPSAALGGSLLSNLGAPENRVPSPDVPFDSCTVLTIEGQLFCNPLVMLARGSASVVFQADLGPAGETASSWTVTFGGRTTSGTSSVSVEFSGGGGRTVQLTETDALYSVSGTGAPSSSAFFRFSFAPNGIELPAIDNVAISVPEPGAAAQALAGVLALLAVARRRA